jgi:beta-phosphoglucomutase-like phosphatase (HAD superfamily)
VEPELVVFDCDGVLADSERISVRIEAALLGRLGWRLTEAELARRFMGRSQRYMVGEVEARLGHAAAPEFAREGERLYLEAFESELGPVDGIVGALDAIAVPICVASSGSHEKMRYTLGHGGSSIVSKAACSAPWRWRTASRRRTCSSMPPAERGSSRRSAVVVEDSAWGVRAARAAGMRALGYAGGLTAAPSLERREPSPSRT